MILDSGELLQNTPEIIANRSRINPSTKVVVLVANCVERVFSCASYADELISLSSAVSPTLVRDIRAAWSSMIFSRSAKNFSTIAASISGGMGSSFRFPRFLLVLDVEASSFRTLQGSPHALGVSTATVCTALHALGGGGC